MQPKARVVSKNGSYPRFELIANQWTVIATVSKPQNNWLVVAFLCKGKRQFTTFTLPSSEYSEQQAISMALSHTGYS